MQSKLTLNVSAITERDILSLITSFPIGSGIIKHTFNV